MTTEARTGTGLALELALASAPTVFTYIREAFDANPPSESDDQQEATHFQSQNKKKEYIPGWSDPGEASFEMNYVPGSATDRFLRTLGGKALVARLTFANGVQILFNCSRQSYETPVPNQEKMTASLSLKVSGDPYMSASATSPRALVAPSISGTPQVGVMLTAHPGEWAGALDFAYQWQADSAGNGTFVDIAGATASSFVPTADQLGDDVRVEVTASNASLSTVANSAETASVAAAA